MLILLVAMAVPALAWRGSGTEVDPYEIRTTGDWRDLANEVMLGNSTSTAMDTCASRMARVPNTM